MLFVTLEINFKMIFFSRYKSAENHVIMDNPKKKLECLWQQTQNCELFLFKYVLDNL